MRHLHIDAFNGIAGDMFLSALLDLGLPVEDLVQTLSALKIDLPPITTTQVSRGHLAATYLNIGDDKAESTTENHEHQHEGHHHKHQPEGHNKGHHHDHDHNNDHKHDHGHELSPHDPHQDHHSGPARTLPIMLEILETSSLPESVCSRAAAVFRRLAESEATIHSKPIDQVQFHEVSGIDTIIDVIGVCALLEAWGVESISCSPVTVGTGSVQCGHGRLSLPAPATAALLKGIPLQQEDTGCEMTTPTGAALVSTLAQRFGPMPAMMVEAIGYGAGKREIAGRSNTVRLFLGECHACPDNAERDTVVQITCNLDDTTGESVGNLIERLIGAGALDASVMPLTMKKGRPGLQLMVLCSPKNRTPIVDLIFAETKTFGLRVQNIEREILQREIIKVEVEGNSIKVKIGRRRGKIIALSPEYECCRAVALATGMPLAEIMRRAEAAAREQTPFP